jgi:hypothetical protein
MEPKWGNPVDGVILPRGTFGNNGETRPAGNTTFEVTFTFQEHADNNRGLGTSGTPAATPWCGRWPTVRSYNESPTQGMAP